MSLLKITILSLVLAIGIVCGLRYNQPSLQTGDQRCGNPDEHPPCWGNPYWPK